MPPGWRGRLLAALLLPIPTLVVLSLHGATAILRLNALGLHDGMRYYEVSLSLLGEPPYCPEPVRYSRILFPAFVNAAAAGVAALVRRAGAAGWLHETFPYDGLVVPNYALLHAFVYHACLLVVVWVGTTVLARYLRNDVIAILLDVVLLQVVVLKGLLTPLDIALVILCIRATDAWLRSGSGSWRAAAGLALALGAGGLEREVFLGFYPVIVVCHLSRHGLRRLPRLATAMLAGLSVTGGWWIAVSNARHMDMAGEILRFARLNSTPLPLQGFPAAIRANPVEAPVLVVLTIYTVVRLVTLVRRAYGRWRSGAGLDPAAVWSIVISIVYLRASAGLLASGVLNFGRILLFAPFMLEDLRRSYELVLDRLGRRLMVGLLGLSTAAYFTVLVWYQSDLIRTSFARIKASSHVQETSGLSLLAERTPTLYRP